MYMRNSSKKRKYLIVKLFGTRSCDGSLYVCSCRYNGCINRRDVHIRWPDLSRIPWESRGKRWKEGGDEINEHTHAKNSINTKKNTIKADSSRQWQPVQHNP